MTTDRTPRAPDTEGVPPAAQPRGGRGGRGRGAGTGGAAGGDRPQRRERRDRQDSPDESGLIERVVQIRRVAKVTSGGRHLTFNAMVVVGDGQGKVGASLGKATAVPDAVRKGTLQARKAMKPFQLSGTTIPHEVVAKFGASIVFLRPAMPGTGIKAGGGVRPVLEAVGVRDVLAKSHGARSTINSVKATLKALAQLRDPKGAIARRRGEPAPGA